MSLLPFLLQGINECDLHKALTKAMSSILSVVKRIPQAPKEDKAEGRKEKLPKGLPPERVQPSRRGKPIELKEFYGDAAAKASMAAAPAGIKKGANAMNGGDAEEAPSEMSLHYALDQIDQLAEKAALAKVKNLSLTEAMQIIERLPNCSNDSDLQIRGPAGGWKTWRHKIRRMKDGDVDEEWVALAAADGQEVDATSTRKQVRTIYMSIIDSNCQPSLHSPSIRINYDVKQLPSGPSPVPPSTC